MEGGGVTLAQLLHLLTAAKTTCCTASSRYETGFWDSHVDRELAIRGAGSTWQHINTNRLAEADKCLLECVELEARQPRIEHKRFQEAYTAFAAYLGRPPQIFYLEVPYAQKDDAKKLGARFDAGLRQWYVPAGLDKKPFSRWISAVN